MNTLGEPSIRLGIVGCGAIVEAGYLPACQRVPKVQVVALVDIDRQQAERLAHQYDVPRVETDYRAILDHIDAVIISTPPALHVEHAGFFLEHGVHVLCEKPLAHDSAGCRHLINLAMANRVHLAVGHVRRFFFYAEQMRILIAHGKLGQVLEIQADEGYPYSWPARTDYAFRGDTSPGGVMFDLGIHALDMFTWLIGPIAHLRYVDDALGGMESNAEVEIAFESGARGRLHLSRTCERPNRLVIRGTCGWVQANIHVPGYLKVQTRETKRPVHLRASRPQTLVSALTSQMDDFLHAVAENRPPRTPGEDGLAAVRLVEQCYQQRRGTPLPQVAPLPGVLRWSAPQQGDTISCDRPSTEPQGVARDLAGHVALVTGATGFIGGRLVEKLILEHGVAVRALVRNFRTATWLSRTTAEMVYGDMADPASLQQAVQGCSLVFHCAVSTSPNYEEAYRINVAGTRHLLEAALAAGVKRFIMVSSAAVHEPVAGNQAIDENTPFVSERADVYARTKLAGEQLALQFGREHGLAVVVLRPTIVYGPRSTLWTTNYVSRITRNQLALWRGLDGVNNLVYVDDVVQALILAATAPVAGEAFIIGSLYSTSWSKYLGYYAMMSGKTVPTWPRWLLLALALTFDLLDHYLMALRRQPSPWKVPLVFGLRAIRRALRPWRRLEHWEMRMFTRQQFFDIAKARRLLGYQPRADMARAMQETEVWLRAQGYLPDENNAVMI